MTHSWERRRDCRDMTPPQARRRSSLAARLVSMGVVLAGMLTAAGTGSPAAAQESTRIGERLYIILWQHDPMKFSNAIRAADEFLAVRPGRRFEIIMDYYGMFAALPGVTTVQREFVEIKRRRPGLTVTVCKETYDRLVKANKRKLPLLPGMQVRTCKDRRTDLEKAGWREALGF